MFNQRPLAGVTLANRVREAESTEEGTAVTAKSTGGEVSPPSLVKATAAPGRVVPAKIMVSKRTGRPHQIHGR